MSQNLGGEGTEGRLGSIRRKEDCWEEVMFELGLAVQSTGGQSGGGRVGGVASDSCVWLTPSLLPGHTQQLTQLPCLLCTPLPEVPCLLLQVPSILLGFIQAHPENAPADSSPGLLTLLQIAFNPVLLSVCTKSSSKQTMTYTFVFVHSPSLSNPRVS